MEENAIRSEQKESVRMHLNNERKRTSGRRLDRGDLTHSKEVVMILKGDHSALA